MKRRFRKGNRVTISGKGRTAKWTNFKQRKGTVKSARGESVFVQWDGLKLLDEDEMSPEELKRIPGKGVPEERIMELQRAEQ